MAIVKTAIVPIHWPRIINDLCHLGLSLSSISLAIGLDRNKVERMRRDGTCPKFDDGEILIEFWMSKTGKSRSEIPRLSRTDWKY